MRQFDRTKVVPYQELPIEGAKLEELLAYATARMKAVRGSKEEPTEELKAEWVMRAKRRRAELAYIEANLPAGTCFSILDCPAMVLKYERSNLLSESMGSQVITCLIKYTDGLKELTFSLPTLRAILE